jgi:uncharacterized phage-associated protein
MTVSAHDIAAALRAHLPGLPTKKLHRLLYYCQGHHLAVFDEPLFGETISAWDMGPVVGELWRQEKAGGSAPASATLGEAELNTIGYVVSRYGRLSGRDLEHLTHGEGPWRLADSRRRPGESVRIELDWIRVYFRSAAAGADDDDLVLDADEVRRFLEGAQIRRLQPAQPDTRDTIVARLTEREPR